MPMTITNQDSTTSRSLHDPGIKSSGSFAAPSPEPTRPLARVRDGSASQSANVSGPRLEAAWSVARMLDGNVEQSATLSRPQKSVPRNERQRTPKRESTRSPALVLDRSASQSAGFSGPRNDGYEISHNGGDWEDGGSSNGNDDAASNAATTGVASSSRDAFVARVSQSHQGAEHARNEHQPWDPATVYVHPGHPPPTPMIPPTLPPRKPHLSSSSSSFSSTPQPLAPMHSPPHLLLSSRHGHLTMKNNTASPAAAALPTPPATPVKKPRSTITAKPFIIRDSPTGGMGAFATRDLHLGEVILEEAPLFVADREGIFSAFARLSRKKQKKAMKLHASDHFKPGTEYLEAIWYTNSFATGRNREAALFPIAARFNHACEPKNNVHFAYDEHRRRLRFWVAGGGGGGGGGVAAGEELRICYGTTKTPALLWQWYGFRCACGACEGLSDEEVDCFSVRW